jgi:UDP-N-acetylmuramyl pentapeptide synthase
MPDTTPPTPAPSKSIFTSRTFAGLALIALPLLAKPLGYTLDDAATQALVENIFQIIGIAVAAYGRLKAAKVITVTGSPAKSAAALLAAWERDAAAQLIDELTGAHHE